MSKDTRAQKNAHSLEQAFQLILVGVYYPSSNAAAPPTISRISLVIAACLALL
jgi:hypothetical protein